MVEIEYKIGDCLELVEKLPAGSIALIITSPPYNVGVHYGKYDDNKELGHYIDYLTKRFLACEKKLAPGGHIAIEMGNTGRHPYQPKTDLLTTSLNQNWELEYRGEIIWDKQNMTSQTAWGSWMNPNMPSIRDRHEYILIWRKEGRRSGKSDIGRDDFLNWTQSIWRVAPESLDRNHPAPFPIEIPYRLIRLFTFVGETVLDPFLGSGTTLLACRMLGRNGLGFELDEAYELVIKEKILEAIPQIETFGDPGIVEYAPSDRRLSGGS